MKIRLEKNPDRSKLESMGIFEWPIWTKEVSEFPWEYDSEETCYFLEGKVVVSPEKGEPARIQKGDLVTFPKGMRCTWKVLEPVRKHYRFE